jgi:hypothetical protein
MYIFEAFQNCMVGLHEIEHQILFTLKSSAFGVEAKLEQRNYSYETKLELT